MFIYFILLFVAIFFGENVLNTFKKNKETPYIDGVLPEKGKNDMKRKTEKKSDEKKEGLYRKIKKTHLQNPQR